MRRLLLCGALLASACNNPVPPTGPTTTVVTTVVTTGGPGSGPMNPQPGIGGTGGTSGPRTADPVSGFLPLPAYGEAIVTQVAASPTGQSLLAQSCYLTYGQASWSFLDAVVDRLRQLDARWGYSCYKGDCQVPANDGISYHATSGPETTGAKGTWIVTVIGGYCVAPRAQWQGVYDPAGAWTSRGRW